MCVGILRHVVGSISAQAHAGLSCGNHGTILSARISVGIVRCSFGRVCFVPIWRSIGDIKIIVGGLSPADVLFGGGGRRTGPVIPLVSFEGVDKETDGEDDDDGEESKPSQQDDPKHEATPEGVSLLLIGG